MANLSSPSGLSRLVPWLISGLSLWATLAGWQIFHDEALTRAKVHFAGEVTEHRSAILNRMQAYEQILRSGVALLDASDHVTRQEWRTFVESLHVARLYPGIQGFGWSVFIRPAELAAHEQSLRAEGFPDYRLRPEGSREIYSSITYLEPFEKRNLRAFGYDMFSEPVRRTAMEQARDSGHAALSGKVTLVQETEADKQAGCLIYLPVYKKSHPLHTVAERRAAIIGFVYAPFRMNDLLQGILRNKHHLVGLRIFDGDTIDPESVLYDSWRGNSPGRIPGTFVHRELLTIAGHAWQMELQSTAVFDASVDREKQFIVLVGGMASSILLFAMIRNLSRSRDQAVKMAQKITADLSINESRTRAILDTAVNGIITMDTARRIITFNPAAEKIFGYTLAEVFGKNVKMLMPDPYHSEHDSYVERYIQTRKSRIIKVGGREVTGQRQDGSTFPLWLAVGEAHVGEEHIFVGCVVDITDRKQTESELLAAKNVAEEANRAKSEFLNTMSHELRTPLTVILGYLPLLGQSEKKIPTAKKLAMALTGTPEAEEFARFVQQIGNMAREMKRNGEHLLTLINDLLDISKIEAGKLTLDLQVIDAEEVVQGVLDALRVKADEKNLQLVGTLTKTHLLADATRLRQILINLVGNAIKFTDRGEVHVTMKPVEKFVEFTVMDTGIGIPAHELDHIFERFHQVDGSTTRRAGGTGLGLTITKKLVEISGGTISVVSAPGTGSTFRFTIPTREET
ncbi:MAG: CHASE domain-containing protein [Magnetococcus sp. DMHC-1]|nr:CHASE domain-containing protein [Magnetococcales bacterium]